MHVMQTGGVKCGADKEIVDDVCNPAPARNAGSPGSLAGPAVDFCPDMLLWAQGLRWIHV